MGLSNATPFHLSAKVDRCQTYHTDGKIRFLVLTGVADYIIYHIKEKNATQIGFRFLVSDFRKTVAILTKK